MQPPKPNVKAILICDNIITEQGTGKNSLIGIFENINAKKFPCRHGNLGVYINFNDAVGRYRFKLELVDLENNKILGYIESQELEYKDKLTSNNLVLVLKDLIFEHPGRYEFRFSANTELSEIKTFNVKQI